MSKVIKMSKPKILTLEFHDFTVLPKEDGLKFVLFRLEKGDILIGYDYGFANYSNKEWQSMFAENYVGKVVKWCRLPNPQLLF